MKSTSQDQWQRQGRHSTKEVQGLPIQVLLLNLLLLMHSMGWVIGFLKQQNSETTDRLKAKCTFLEATSGNNNLLLSQYLWTNNCLSDPIPTAGRWTQLCYQGLCAIVNDCEGNVLVTVVVVTQVYAFVKLYRTAHLKGSDVPHINFTSIKQTWSPPGSVRQGCDSGVSELTSCLSGISFCLLG